jgi:hypothetical protein
MVSLSQQSMSAGVPPHEMASQDVPVVASPTMVSEVMAMEEINPWSDAKQVEVLMSSPLTRVKEPMYLTASQDLSRDREARKMEKVERLRIQSVKDAEKKRGRAATQQDLDSMEATCDSSVALDKTRETGGGHKSSQSSGGSYQTCTPEQKSIEPNPAQGQGVELLLGGGEQLV